MSYEILPKNVKEFVSDTTIKLPRFQRKATWKPIQNFNLCISMFKDYPLGVVIVNGATTENGQVNYLLDGRQRRHALKSQIENPLELYANATTALGLKGGMSEQDVRECFWKKVGGFLSEKADDDETDKEGSEGRDGEADEETKKSKLNLMLDLIIMVHGQGVSKDWKKSPWLRRWDFSKFFSYLPYFEEKKIDPVKLRDFIINKLKVHLSDNVEKITAESLIAAYTKELGASAFKRRAKDEFPVYIEQMLPALKRDIQILNASHSTVYSEAKVGVIAIKDVSNLDRQKIFSLVNTGGTPLKAEELLSAKPFWNKKVDPSILSADTKNKIIQLYENLGIPGGDDAYSDQKVYWDMCATLIDRIDKNNLVFSPVETGKKQADSLMNRIVWGFKLAASCIVGGFSAKYMDKLELDKVDIPDEIEKLVADINDIIGFLQNDDFYKRFKSWGKPIVELLGFSAAFEFLALLRQRWNGLGCATGANKQKFLHESYVEFDRLVFEYTSGDWGGASDSKLSKNLMNVEARVKPLPDDAWVSLIQKECSESCSSYSRKTAFLYYFNVISKLQPASSGDYRYDVDHIMPQSLFKSIPQGMDLNPKLQDVVANLALLPSSKNVTKKDKKLNELGDSLKKEVSKYSAIEVSDFEKYSSLLHLSDLIDLRKQMFMKVNEYREALFLS